MGSNDERYKWLLSDAKPQHEVTLPIYYIACYPVTMAQFRALVDKTGYERKYKDVQGPSNHPVVVVNWHDALAYCDWLTERLRVWEGTPEPLAARLRHEGWQVTLPSKAECEKAAQGTDGRGYPWRNDPDPNRALGQPVQWGAFQEG
jgi:formylglycine-generating enzyme required for sulfatase activity